MHDPPRTTPERPIAFAHRGARAHARENTLDAFRLGLELGANGLESDVWVTADGVPVLDHDGVIPRRMGRKVPIASVQRRSLPAHIPTVAELYELLGRRAASVEVSLDVKDPAAAGPLLDTVAEVAPDGLERLWLCLPDLDGLLALRGRGARLVHSTHLRNLPHSLERHAAILQRDGIDVLNMHHTEWSAGRVALLHRFGRGTFGWDLQEPHLLAKALDQGLDGIYSDWVDRMVAAYELAVGAPPR